MAQHLTELDWNPFNAAIGRLVSAGADRRDLSIVVDLIEKLVEAGARTS